MTRFGGIVRRKKSLTSKKRVQGKQMANTEKVAVITGGAQGIGRAICDAFSEQGVVTCTIDVQKNDYFVAALSG